MATMSADRIRSLCRRHTQIDCIILPSMNIPEMPGFSNCFLSIRIRNAATVAPTSHLSTSPDLKLPNVGGVR